MVRKDAMHGPMRLGAACALVLALGLGGAVAARAEGAGRIDVNKASVMELTALPGIGPAKAEAIVEERERRPFTSVDDLTRVSGIGDRTIEQLRDRISVGEADKGGNAGR
jgi:competence protein ComEA